jgi:putative DNA methylase
MMRQRKLIEVALPLQAINEAAARAVIFAQMVDDPSSHPERFPTEEAQEKERQRLFRLIEQLVLWENTTNETVLAQAREEIWKSWRATCAGNKNHRS